MLPEKTSWPPIHSYFLLLIIFMTALILKLLIFFFATDPIIFFKYPFFAKQLSQGMDIGERLLDLSPFYLYFNYLFYRIYGENWEALAIIQIILGSLNCLFVYAIGEKLFNRTVGFLGALILLFYGNLTLIELTLEPEIFVLLFNSLFVLSLLTALNRPGLIFYFFPWLLVGITSGLSMITKANGLLLIPLALLGISWAYSPWDQKIKAALTVLLGVALVLGPITVRNYIKFHDLVFITADGGKVFYHGNGPGSTGIERADLPGQGFLEEGSNEPDYAHVLFRQAARTATGRPLSPSECSRYWVTRTWEHFKQNLLSSSFLIFKKLILFWGDYEVQDIDSTYKNYTKIRAFPLISFGMIAVTGLAGMVLTARKYRRLWPLHGMVAIYVLSVLIFFAASRYRLPAVPFLAIFAAYFGTFLFKLFQEKKYAFASLLIWGPILVAIGLHFPFRNEISHFDRWQTATRIHYSLGGNLFFQKGLYREAVAELEKAVALEPHFSPAYNLLGMSYANLNDLESAEKNFLKVIALSPGWDQGYLNLALLYQRKGDLQKAFPLLQKALSLNPDHPKAKKLLQDLKVPPSGR